MKNHNQKIFIIILLFLSGLGGFAFSLYMHGKNELSRSTTQITTFHYPATFVKQIAGDKHAGEKIFKEFCTSCHASKPLIDIDAPRIDDKKAWQLRQKMGMPFLLKMTIRGVGAMPARGGCFECSDEQLQEAIQYMLTESVK